MKIAIIGTGNVGGALASRWADKSHEISLGVKDTSDFKGRDLLSKSNISVHPVKTAVTLSDVVLIATPAIAAVEVARSLGDTTEKVIIDAMNIVMGRGPTGYENTTEAILDNTQSKHVVKCFNTTGFNNMADTSYGDVSLDMFVAGDSKKAKDIASQLALDAGFDVCYDVGGNDKFSLMEQFAWFWINLAMVQGLGREIGFKLLRR